MPDTIQHKTKYEAVEASAVQVKTGMDAPSWMVAVWRIEDGKLVLARTTYNFPAGEFQEAIRGLGDVLMEEAGTIPAMPGPLPRAAVNLLGDRNEAIEVIGGNGSTPMVRVAGEIVRDASGETRPSADDSQQ